MITVTNCNADGRPSSTVEYPANGPFSHLIALDDFFFGLHEGGAVLLNHSENTDDGTSIDWKVSTGWDNPTSSIALKKVDFVYLMCGGCPDFIDLSISFDDGAVVGNVCKCDYRPSVSGVKVNTRSLCQGVTVSLSMAGSGEFYLKKIYGLIAERAIGFGTRCE